MASNKLLDYLDGISKKNREKADNAFGGGTQTYSAPSSSVPSSSGGLIDYLDSIAMKNRTIAEESPSRSTLYDLASNAVRNYAPSDEGTDDLYSNNIAQSIADKLVQGTLAGVNTANDSFVNKFGGITDNQKQNAPLSQYYKMLDNEDFEVNSRQINDRATREEEARKEEFLRQNQLEPNLAESFRGAYDAEALEDEKRIYTYLWNTQGKDRADQYWEELTNRELKKRAAKTQKEKSQKFGEENPILASIASIPLKPFQTVEGAKQLLDFATTGKLNEDDALNSWVTNMNTGLRQGASDRLSRDVANEWVGFYDAVGLYALNNVGMPETDKARIMESKEVKDMQQKVRDVAGGATSKAYGVTMSIADNLYNLALAHFITGTMPLTSAGRAAAKTTEELTTAIMGSSVVSESIIQAKERGLDDGQAATIGLASGVIEWLTEHIGMEALFDSDKALLKGQIAKYVRKSMYSEGAEEVLSDLGNWVVDEIVTGDKSEFNTRINELMAQGMSKEEAQKQALIEKVMSMGESFLAGAISGGVLGGGGAVIGVAQNANTIDSMGLRDNANLQALIEQGLASSPVTDSYQVATGLQSKLDNGQRIKDSEIMGQIYANDIAIEQEHDNAMQTIAESSPNMSQAAISTMQMLYGDNMDATEYAQGMHDYYLAGYKGESINSVQSENGAKLTPIQQKAIYDLGKEELNEELRIRKGGKRNDSTDTNRLVSEVDENAGRFEERNYQAADREIASVTFGEEIPAREVVPNGTDRKVRLVTGNLTPSLKYIESDAKKFGFKVKFVSGLIESTVRDGEKGLSRGQVSLDNKTIYVQVDNPDFTAKQIYEHEKTHWKIANGEINLKEVGERIKDQNYARLAKDYAYAYHIVDVDEDGKEIDAVDNDYILEEIICDANAGMNIFKNFLTRLEQEHAPTLDSIKEEVSKETNQANAPPVETENKGESEVKTSAVPTMDSDGRELSKGMSEYMKDSKVRDENGNLKVMYHGTETVGFKVFDSSFSDDGISFFFTDNKRMAETYSGGTSAFFLDEYVDLSNEKAVRKYFKGSDYKLQKKDGVYSIYSKEFEDIVGIESENLEEVMEQFEYDFGGKINSAVYPVYLNVTNPLIVNANGSNWNNLDSSMIENATTDEELTETRDFAEYAKNNGFDGVIFNNVLDYGAHELYGAIYKPSTVVVAFESNQIKAITNENPTENPDIRFSTVPTMDSEGRKLSKGMSEYMKNSQVRDENGNLMVMYHGTENGGFTVFDSRYGISSKAFFFTNNPVVAKGYSGTSDTFKAPIFNTIEEAQNAINNDMMANVEIKEEDGKYVMYEDGDFVDESTDLNALYGLYNDYSGFGGDVANYEVYLNVTNPLVIDAKGAYWGEIETDFADEPMTTNAIAEYAQKNGYDGVIVHNVIDSGIYNTSREYVQNGATMDVIVFDSNQVKLTSNENPTENKDIRFSSEPTKDSLGNNLTKEQGKFFKDSQVRDSEGNLMVMYHGTEAKFTVFKPNEFLTEKNGLTKIVGYFSEDAEYASNYGNVKPYYLNITNPFVFDGRERTLKEWNKYFKDRGVTGVKFDSSVSGENYRRETLKGANYGDGDFYFNSIELLDAMLVWYGDGNLTERIMAAGYDGIHTDEEVEKAWMPFDPSQIKSVDNKKPTSDPDTRFSAEPTKDTQGNDISKGMGKFMKDSKIRNAEGNLRVMYHGTESDIAEFKPQQFGGQNGTAEGYGIYFSDDPEVTSKYGSVQLKGYLNVTHPASSLEKTIKTNDLIKLIEATAQKEATRLVEEGYDSIEEALKDTWVSNYEYTYDKPMSEVYRKVANDIIRMNPSDMDIVQEVMAGNAVRNYEQAYDFYDTLGETLGIDGFVTEWTHADGKSLIVVALYSNQFKSIDNENPTSSPEIKFSMEAESMLDKVSTREGDIRKFSMETYSKGGQYALAEYLAKYSNLSKADQKDILNSLEWGYSVAEEMSKNKAFTAFSNWSRTGIVRAADGTPLLEITGLSGAPLRSVIVTNGEYPLNIDFTTVCKKRMALDAILNKLASDTNINLGELSEEDFAGINRLIREHGFEIACGLCYVDAKRYKVSKYANTFVNGDDKVEGTGKTVHTYGWNELVNSMLKRGANASYFELSAEHVRPLGTLLSELDDKDIDFRLIDKIIKPHLKKDGTLGSATEEVRRAYLLKTDPSSRHLLDMNDIIASEGLDALKTINPELWKLVTTHGAQAAPKASMGFTAYGNDILKAKAFTKENAYKVGGVRVQSFSDYVANMFFDYMQMFADMSARELPSHAYTKEPNYVRLFGMTGQRINMSLIFKGANLTSDQAKRLANLSKKGRKYVLADPEFGKLAEHAGLDNKGNYIYENESFPPEVAYELRKDPRYKNCGTIAVGLSDAHIRKLLADPQIDMVIPYHASGVSQFIKNERNLVLYTDYTEYQSTKDGNGKKLKKEFDWYANLKNGIQDGVDAKANADAYLEWCDENGYTPKFPQFRDDANYYKLLADFRSYDNNGKFMPQNKVTMTFPENFRDIVNESLKEHQESYYGKLDAELSNDQNSLYAAVKDFLKEKSVAKFSQVPTSNTELAKENRKLKKDLADSYKEIQKWKDEIKITNPLKVRYEDVKKISNTFRKKYSSTMTKAELEAKFKEFGDYVLNASNDKSMSAEEYAQNVKAMAVDLASDLVHSSEELIVNYPEYEDVKRHLMQGVSISDEDKANIPDFDTFRKANFGNVRIKNSGSSVDTVYEELNGLYPYLFPDEITHPADRLLRMAAVAEEIKPTYGNPFEQYGYDMAGIVETVANDIVENAAYGQLRATRKSFADKQAEKIKGLESKISELTEDNQALSESNKEKVSKDKYTAMVQALKDKKKEDLLSLKEHYKEKERRTREKRNASTLRKKIEKHCQDLSAKLLKPTDKKHITELRGVREGKDMESLKSVTAKVLSLINRESTFAYASEDGAKHAQPGDMFFPTAKTEAMRELQKAYESIAKDGDYLSDEAMLGTDGWIADIIEFADKPLGELNTEQLQKIYNCLRSLEKTIDSANKLLSTDKSMGDVAYAFKDETEGKKEKLIFPIQKLNDFAISLLTPQAFFERMGKVGDMLFGELRGAQNSYISNTKILRDWIKENKIGEARAEWQDEEHVVRLGGADVKMSTPMLMELYVLAKRPQALDHILDGGIAFTEVQKKKLKYQKQVYRGITMEQLSKAFSQLSAEQIKVADMMQSYASNELSALGNKASMDVYGYEKFTEDNYWRIRVKETELQRDNVHDKPQSPTSVANKGMTKQTVDNPNSALYIDDIFKTFLDHAVDMNSYASYLAVQEDMRRLFNYKFYEDGVKMGTFQELLEQNFGGRQGGAYWTKLMQDIANGVGSSNLLSGGLIGKFKATAVGANLRVVVQQPTAILRAMDMIDGKYLAIGAAHPWKGSKEAIKYSPLAQWKNWGYFDINTGRSLEDLVYDTTDLKTKAEEVMMKPAGAADDFAWGILWNAVKAEVKDKNPNLKPGSKEYFEVVKKRFEHIVDRTQVVDGILQRSGILREGDMFTKTVTAFMGEPIKQYNQFMNAIYNLRQGKVGKGMVARTVFAMASAGMLNAVVKSIVDAMRKSDRDKDYFTRWLEEFAGIKDGEWSLKTFSDSNMFELVDVPSYIPIARDVESIVKGYTVERSDMAVIASVVKSYQTFLKAMNGEGKLTMPYAIANFSSELAKLFGIPASNIKRDLMSLTDTLVNDIIKDDVTLAYNYNKLFYDVNKDKARFTKLLDEARQKGDMSAYEYILEDLKANGFEEDKIVNSLNNLQKQTEGVTKVSEIEKKAFPNTESEKEYNTKMSSITNSSVYSRASKEQQDKIRNEVYSLVRDDNASLETSIQKAKNVGISESDWILYTLARRIADQNGDNNGAYNASEKQQAAAMVGISYDKIKAMNKK